MRTINRIKAFSEKHYYALIIFAFIMMYSIFIPGEMKLWEPSEAVLAIHAVDFGMGFCSKLLPGAIYNLFFDSVSTVKTALYLMLLLTCFFAALSFLLEKFILNIESEYRKTALILLAFFLTGPATFAIHVYYPGMLDMYWVFCALLFFVFLTKKQLTPLVFLPVVLCVTVYYSSLICFIPFFVIILLYKISCTQEKKERTKLWYILIFSTAAAVGLGIYFAVFESDNLVYSMEEFHEIYSSRGTNRFFYYDMSLYKSLETPDLEEFAIYTFEGLPVIVSEIVIRIAHTLTNSSLKYQFVALFLILPIMAFIFRFLHYQIKTNKENKLQHFSLICMLLLPFATILCALCFSEDTVRWFAHAFVPLFSSFFIILYYKRDSAWIWVKEKISKIPLTVILLYLTFYASSVYHPYYIG